MIYNGGNLLDRDFHQSCEHYNRCGERAVVEIIRIDKDRNYERETAQAEVLIVNEGSSNVSFRGIGEVSLKAGQMIIVPPDILLSVTAADASVILFMEIDLNSEICRRLDFENLSKYKSGIKGVINPLDVKTKLQANLDAMIPFIEDGLLCKKYMQGKIAEFMHIVAGYYNMKELAGFFRPLLDSDIIFRHIIETNIRRFHTLEEYALLTKMSRRGFYDKFLRVYGVPPKNYIMEKRAQLILHDLKHTEVPLKSIATQYGFNSYEVFFRFCVKMLGTAPSNLRF